MGSELWNAQQEAVQSLNMQAHASAQAHADEFVKEALLSHGKLDTLLMNQLAFEVRHSFRAAAPLPRRKPRRKPAVQQQRVSLIKGRI